MHAFVCVFEPVSGKQARPIKLSCLSAHSEAFSVAFRIFSIEQHIKADSTFNLLLPARYVCALQILQEQLAVGLMQITDNLLMLRKAVAFLVVNKISSTCLI